MEVRPLEKFGNIFEIQYGSMKYRRYMFTYFMLSRSWITRDTIGCGFEITKPVIFIHITLVISIIQIILRLKIIQIIIHIYRFWWIDMFIGI
jgi:hypothetical protein